MFLLQLWQINVAEQMILNDMEINPKKYEGKSLSDLADEEDFDEENAVEYTEAYYKNTLLPKTILVSTIRMELLSFGCCTIHLLFVILDRKQVSKSLT